MKALEIESNMYERAKTEQKKKEKKKNQRPSYTFKRLRIEKRMSECHASVCPCD